MRYPKTVSVRRAFQCLGFAVQRNDESDQRYASRDRQEFVRVHDRRRGRRQGRRRDHGIEVRSRSYPSTYI